MPGGRYCLSGRTVAATSGSTAESYAAAYFMQTVSAVGITQNEESRTRLVAGLFAPTRGAGLGVDADKWNIVHAVEHAIAAAVATGQYERLREEYGLPAALSPFR